MKQREREMIKVMEGRSPYTCKKLRQISSEEQRCVSLLLCCSRCGCHSGGCGGCLGAYEHRLSLIFYQ